MKFQGNLYRQRFLPLEYRFWWKVALVGATPDDCWEWRSNVLDNGYGQFDQHLAHRIAYGLAVGPIPNGLVIDHLCHTEVCAGGVCEHRRCVNPRHLKAVTQQENVLRAPTNFAAMNAAKTHCAHGHPFDEENTWHHQGERVCRECSRERTRQWRARNK